MNVYDWMKETDNTPPMNEPGTREDPGNRPHVPDEDGDTTRELHSGAGGGRDPVDGEHQTEHTIADPEQTVSNEGIVESVRKLFGVHNRGKKFVELDGNAGASIGKIYKTIEDTFASKEWLDKQTPVKGDVKVGDLLQNIDPKNLTACVQETFAINLSFAQAVDKAQMAVLETLGPVLQLWEPQKLTDKVYDATMKVLSSVSSVNELVKKPTRTRTNLLPSKGEPTAQPLSIDAILELATTINKCMRTDVSRIDNQGDSLDKAMGGFSEAYYNISRQDSHSESYNNDAWEKLASRVFDKLSPNGVQEALAAMRQFSATCIDCVIYMERSIKGGKVSNESFTVSNEGIFDSIKALFAKKPESLDVKWVDESLKKSFDKTLLNDAWLDKQKLSTGTVTVTFPKAAVKGDYKALGKAMKNALDDAEAKNIQVGKKHYEPVMKAFKAMNKDIGKRSIEDIQNLRDIATYDDMDFDAPWVEPKQVTSPEGPMDLPVLDKAGIKAAANAIIEYSSMLADYNEACMIYLPDNDTHATWRIILENTPDKSKLPLLKEYHDDLDSIYDYSHESFFNQCTGQWELVENLTYGLMRWISKSISGVNFSE